MPSFGVIFRSEGWYLCLKIKMCQNGQFHHFQGKKSCTFDFLKNVWVVFRSYLSIIFGFKRPIFKFVISAKEVDKWPQIKSVGQILAVWDGYFGRFQVQKSRLLDIFEVAFELFRIRIGIVLFSEYSKPDFLSFGVPRMP